MRKITVETHGRKAVELLSDWYANYEEACKLFGKEFTDRVIQTVNDKEFITTHSRRSACSKHKSDWANYLYKNRESDVVTGVLGMTGNEYHCGGNTEYWAYYHERSNDPVNVDRTLVNTFIAENYPELQELFYLTVYKIGGGGYDDIYVDSCADKTNPISTVYLPIKALTDDNPELLMRRCEYISGYYGQEKCDEYKNGAVFKAVHNILKRKGVHKASRAAFVKVKALDTYEKRVKKVKEVQEQIEKILKNAGLAPEDISFGSVLKVGA